MVFGTDFYNFVLKLNELINKGSPINKMVEK